MAENNFVNIKIKIGNDYKNVPIEKGISFENNGAKYLVDKDGKLHKLDKKTNIWSAAKSIEMTNYQYKTFQSIADNDDKNGLSQKDIKKAMEQYSKSELSDDIKKELPNGYSIEKHSTGFTNKLKNGVEIGIAYNDKHQAGLKFELAQDATIKQATQKQNGGVQTTTTTPSGTKIVKYTKNPQTPNILKENCLKSNLFNSTYKNVQYLEPEVYTVKNQDTPDKIIKKYGIDFFEFFAANPNIDYKVEYDPIDPAKISMIGYIHPGDKLNIPARYKIKPGSVKNLEDVVNATGVSKEYIEKILIQMEPLVPGQPDLKAYYDSVNGKGALTIGFGHTGRDLDGNPITKASEITEEQAYELLAQDILNNKVRTITYMEQHGISKKDFDKIPESLQSVIIDIAFNKGIYDGFENAHHNYTIQLKKDLNDKNYALGTIHTNRVSNVVGLEKRSMYRLIYAMEDLSSKDKQIVRDTADKEVKRVIARLKKNSPREAELLEKAWADTLNKN